MAEQFFAGASEVDITPPVGLPMDGYMARVGVSQGVHDPLLAQVLVLDDANRRVALVAMDVLAVGAAFADTLRLSLATLLTMNPNAVLVCASHTHAGPAGLHDWFAGGTGTALNLQIKELL